jgi:glycosyltransferase involved in cell wall biosynthesis
MKVIGLIPAYNAVRTIREVIGRIPEGSLDSVIVVDDGSRDRTSEALDGMKNVRVVRHPENRGYGAAQITLYKTALEMGADATIIFHADGGHLPEEIPQMMQPILDRTADVVVGSRMEGILKQVEPLAGSRMLSALVRGPMPGYKFLFHVLLTSFQNICYGTRFRCFHSGFRACTGLTLNKIPFDQLTTWYDYDTEFLLACHHAGARIGEVPVSAFYDARAGSSAPSIRYGLRVVRHALTYRLRPRRSAGHAGIHNT